MKAIAVKKWEREGRLYAEWSDRATDDKDRYSDDSIIIMVSCPVEEGDKKLNALLWNAYDAWIAERA